MNSKLLLERELEHELGEELELEQDWQIGRKLPPAGLLVFQHGFLQLTALSPCFL